MSQPWDVPLPLFGDQDAVPEPRVLSRREEDDAAKVQWRPYKGVSLPCDDCVVEAPQGLRMGIGRANHVRKEGPDEKLLCYFHKSEYLAREQRASHGTHQ